MDESVDKGIPSRIIEMNDEPMELCVPFKFRASHSLSVREEVHSHDWGLKVFLSRKVYRGELFVADILEIRKLIQPVLDSMEGKNLNDQFNIPTCEYLCRYFLSSITHGLKMLKDANEINEEVRLVAIQVELMEDGKSQEWGSVKLLNPWRKND